MALCLPCENVKTNELERMNESERFLDYEVLNRNPDVLVILESEMEFKVFSDSSINLGGFLGIHNIHGNYGFMAGYTYERFVFSYIYDKTVVDEQNGTSKFIQSHNLGIAYKLF